VRIKNIESDSTVYAITDVHGMRGLLNQLTAEIDRDAVRFEKPVVVFMGDTIDRGPDSRGVLEDIKAWEFDKVFLMGNHEEMFIEWTKLGRPDALADSTYFLMNGGRETVISYGGDESAMARDIAGFASWFDAASTDRFIFVHAGIMPGVRLKHQDVSVTRWIRDRFLNSEEDHEKIVVHGHTPSLSAPDVKKNRVNLDAGSSFSGRLVAGRFSPDGSMAFVESSESGVRWIETHQE